MQAKLVKCSLDRRQVDFAVALRRVRIATPQQRTFDKHRQIDRRSLDHLAHIHVAAEGSGWNGAVAAGLRPCHTENAGKRPQGHRDAGRELRGRALQVEVKITHLADGKSIGKLAEAELARKVPVRAIAPRHDTFDVDFQRIAGLGFLDVNRSGDGMRTAAGMGQPQFRQLLDRDPREDLIGRRHHGLHRHAGAGTHFQHRRLGIVEPAPLRGLRCRRQDIDVPEFGADRRLHACARFLFRAHDVRQPGRARDRTGLQEEPPARIVFHHRDPIAAAAYWQAACHGKLRHRRTFRAGSRFLCAAGRRRAQCRSNGRHP